MGRKGGGVPDRWEDYSNIGTLVEGTSFLAFKVPLKAALLAQVSLVWIDRSRTAYIVDIWFAIFRCPKKRRGHGVCQTSSPPAPALRLLLTWPIHTGCIIFFFPLSCNLLRYYSPKELESKGVKHVKILTEGKVVPSEGVVQQFYRWPVNILSKIGKHVFFIL